ncbi:3-oxoacyl-ACP synthase III family protein [Paenibacillus contaminans]|uniref:3-oxoacyl-ACP synthase n=1 Tax=Paenibacillus contaminans TaxID=450362 RepID=A0A329M0Q4_9BACL|nr:ketoacyl-ACP synthase III [Paenibacillus contaminans]RAV13785.1 3-oxoacyl-ACP synthase [Paenibacillus contaminans]
MRHSYIKAIDYYLPVDKEYNDPNDRLTGKIGINSKSIAGENEFASDLACKAAEKLFSKGKCTPDEIDFILYCTQSPDYLLPTTACLLQERLSLPTSCGALDINLGCSGYVYGLSLAKGLIETGAANNVLLITSDTYSKYANPKDRSVRLLFGDAASVTLLSYSEDGNSIGPFVFGTDGKGANNLIVPAGGLREPMTSASYEEVQDEFGNIRSRSNLYMNGNEIFNFALKEVPKAVQSLLQKGDYTVENFDYFVFHQANQYMLETLRRKLNIQKEKFSVQFADCGNTVSSTIPIALLRDFEEGKMKYGDQVMLVGFGVGYSWAACSIKMKL